MPIQLINTYFTVDSIYLAPVAGNMNIGDRESTKLVLEVVEVAENNGLKLPREFGLLLKQVSLNFP